MTEVDLIAANLAVRILTVPGITRLYPSSVASAVVRTVQGAAGVDGVSEVQVDLEGRRIAVTVGTDGSPSVEVAARVHLTVRDEALLLLPGEAPAIVVTIGSVGAD